MEILSAVGRAEQLADFVEDGRRDDAYDEFFDSECRKAIHKVMGEHAGQPMGRYAKGLLMALTRLSPNLCGSAKLEPPDPKNIRSFCRSIRAEAGGVDPAPQEPEGDGSKKPVNLQRWAIGVEADRWWVFQWFSNHKEWRERGRLDLPRGRVQGLARLLAEHGGTISKDQAVDLFRTDGKQTWGRKKVYDSVCVPARRDLVKAIRGAVSRVSKQKVQGDPIPWDQSAQAWQAAIEIGYSVKDHDGKLNFKTRDQLDSTDLADL